MIRNFTKAEWSALTNAVSQLEQDLEQNPENYLNGEGPRILAALNRAYSKAYQLAPEDE